MYNLTDPFGSNFQPISPAKEYRPWSQINPATRIPSTGYVNPYAILDELAEQYNRQPVTYKTDPITGQVIATRSMAKPELPTEMFGSRFGEYFTAPIAEGGVKPKSEYLTSEWILPKGALTSPAVTSRQVPTSDYERTMGENLGISGLGSPNVAQVNPLAFWPKSTFNVPMREPMEGGKPEPAFGTTVNYETGKWFAPPTTGWGTQETYGKFPSALKTSPGYRNVPMMGGFKPLPMMPSSFLAPPSGQLVTYKKRREYL